MLIDGGHWGTERIFVPVMSEFLKGSFEGRLEVAGSAVNQDPWR
jgi:putative NIF3 family GTP cyclohydrolase 1 type 2